MATLETTTLAGPEDAQRFLLAVGVQGPVLHPRANVPDLGWQAPYRWNGWNRTLAIGSDANGQPVKLESVHYASEGSKPQWAGGSLIEDGIRLGNVEFAWENIAWPVEAMPAIAIILHPEHTPGVST